MMYDYLWKVQLILKEEGIHFVPGRGVDRVLRPGKTLEPLIFTTVRFFYEDQRLH